MKSTNIFAQLLPPVPHLKAGPSSQARISPLLKELFSNRAQLARMQGQKEKDALFWAHKIDYLVATVAGWRTNEHARSLGNAGFGISSTSTEGTKTHEERNKSSPGDQFEMFTKTLLSEARSAEEYAEYLEVITELAAMRGVRFVPPTPGAEISETIWSAAGEKGDLDEDIWELSDDDSGSDEEDEGFMIVH